MRFLVFILLACSSVLSFAQNEDYNFYKLDNYTGLSHNQVNAILKDSDGFLWFGTSSGLNRYDGYACRIFRKNFTDTTSLLDNNVQSLYELPEGKIWVSTISGPCIYDLNTEKFDANTYQYLKSIGLPQGDINHVVKGNNGRYWFLYNNYDLYLYSTGSKKAIFVGQKLKDNNSEHVSTIKETNDGKLWLAYQSGLLKQYDINADKVIFSTEVFRGKLGSFPGIFIDSDGDIWLWSFNNGVFLFQPNNNSVKSFNETSSPSRLSSNLVYRVVEDNKGLIWVATDHGGVDLINKKNNFNTRYLLNDPRNPRSLGQNSITAMYKDDRGIIWLGTYKQGVSYLNSNIVLFPNFQHRDGDAKSLPYNDVNKFAEDKLGNLWIGTNGGGLIYFDRKNNLYKQYLHNAADKNSLSSNIIVSLCVDKSGILWIGTYLGGLNSFDGKKFTNYKHKENDPSSLSNDNVWEIFEDKDDNLWIGTLGNGVDRMDRATGTFSRLQEKGAVQSSLAYSYVSTIMQDTAGNLWVGSTGGISVFDRSNNFKLSYILNKENNNLSHNNILCILQDGKQRVWVGTSEGLNLYDASTKRFHRFTTADGLPDNMVLNIIEDDLHTLWISTPNGLWNLIPRQEKGGLVFSVVGYDETNNLQGREFNDNAALKTKKGELIFGGPSGFNIIDPEKIPKSSFQPKIIFAGLQILRKNVEPGELVNNRVLLQKALSQLDEITLKYKENVFSVEVVSLDFGQSAGDKFAYMLEGFNSDWLYAAGPQQTVTYMNLDPGHYTLKVKVLNKDGLWSPAKTLKITIDPPLWRTPVAYIIYFIAAAALLLFARRIILERIYMRYEVQHQRREAERIIALDQLKTKFFTNVSHEFRTPLTLIISPLDKMMAQATNEEQKKQLGLVQRNAKRLLRLVNQLLDFRKMEAHEIKLHPAIGDIIVFCKDVCNSFVDLAERKKIQYSFSSNVESLQIYFDRDKMEKILFNLLSNAFKYTHDNGSVKVMMNYDPSENDTAGKLTIEVEDTGIGIEEGMQEKIFENFFQTDVPQSMVNQGTGVGLAITKEFVKLHNGTITVKSTPEMGSCFTIVLPANKIYDASNAPATTSMEVDAAEINDQEGVPRDKKKRTILIVDDNEDIRFYLKENLKGQYNIEEAANGKAGLEKIKQLNPDLVVSDVMMPLMDGVEFVRQVKAETATAHIPVILLTAMGNEEKQLEGLRAGANDYVTKPFTFEILNSRIRNLLAQQESLQKRFQKQIEVNPAEVTITPVDEKFLKQALEVVEKNIGNADFSVEDFSRDMFMNRVTLYRKILSITGKSPADFIRSMRLKRAARFLEQSGMSISEIAYEVGFNNPKNFTKAFKEEFNILPSQYAANSRNKSN